MFDLTEEMKNFLNIFSSKKNYHLVDEDDFFDIEIEEEEEEYAKDENDIYSEWVDQFLNSSSFEKLTEEQKEEADFVLHCFFEHLVYVNARHFTDWNTKKITQLCLEIFPRKITTELTFFKCVGPVLISFFNFLSENKLLKQALKLSTCIKAIQYDISKQAADSRNWGIAKTVAMRALKEDVDLSDPTQNEKFIKQLNQELKRTP